MGNQNNFSLVRVAGVVSALVVILGALTAVDSRYVGAEDFKKEVFTIKNELKDLRRVRIEDEIFKLELIPEQKRTQAEKAMLERYRSQLKEIDQRRLR